MTYTYYPGVVIKYTILNIDFWFCSSSPNKNECFIHKSVSFSVYYLIV